MNAIDALKHPYFSTPPLPARPGDIPTFEDSHELDRRRFRGQRAAMPPAPAGGSVGMGRNGGWSTNSGNRTNSDARNPRVPGAPRGVKATSNGSMGNQRRDTWNNDSQHTRQRRINDDSNQSLASRHRDGGLPPKPPAPTHHEPWMTGHPDKGGRDRGYGPRYGGPEASVDSYIPIYSGSDRNRERGQGPTNSDWRGSYHDKSYQNKLDYSRDNPSRRRSRSPMYRERVDRGSYRR